jgi:hypothetical protein
MPITRKPKPAPTPTEREIEAVINKGGSVARTTEPTDEGQGQLLSSVLLRIPVDMLARVDASVKRRLPVRISRVSWIIEALQERLEREERDIN